MAKKRTPRTHGEAVFEVAKQWRKEHGEDPQGLEEYLRIVGSSELKEAEAKWLHDQSFSNYEKAQAIRRKYGLNPDEPPALNEFEAAVEKGLAIYRKKHGKVPKELLAWIDEHRFPTVHENSGKPKPKPVKMKRGSRRCPSRAEALSQLKEPKAPLGNDTQVAIWEALNGRCLIAKEISRDTNIPLPTIKENLRPAGRLRAKGFVDHRRGLGYFRPDAKPPAWPKNR